MSAAVDKNVLLDILRPNPAFAEAAEQTLARELTRGGLVICECVYAELASHFSERLPLEDFQHDVSISFLSSSRETLFAAAQAHRAYRQRGGGRERILADCLIGAHALNQASRLVTRDRGFYRDYFPGLAVVEPTIESTNEFP